MAANLSSPHFLAGISLCEGDLRAALGPPRRFCERPVQSSSISSTAPIDASRVLPLPPRRQEPRAALETSLRVGGRTVRIANVHLDWLDDSPERLAQAEALRDALTPLRGGPLVVGGDLNDTPASAALAVLLTAEDGALTRATGAGATFPADEPRKTIDHLLYGPSDAWRASALSVVDERLASDHRPILLDLTLAVEQ
jgi:endonuclease/exonuclease/phosphatase family metal-dependent hydrolase